MKTLVVDDVAGVVTEEAEKEGPLGIVIRDIDTPGSRPVISAFIWGGKVRPIPTLPFGRWKASA